MRRTLFILVALVSVGFGLGAAAPVTAETVDNESAIELDDNSRITDYHFSDGSVTIEIEADRPTTITIADGMAGVGEAGATRVPETTKRVRPGTQSVTMSTTTVDGGEIVGVSSGEGTVRLATEMDDSGDDPLQYFGGQSGLFTGMGLSMLLSLTAAGFVVWREESGVIEA